MGFERVTSPVLVYYDVMRSNLSEDVENKPENRAFEVCLKRLTITSHSDFHVHVNVYLILPNKMLRFDSSVALPVLY